MLRLVGSGFSPPVCNTVTKKATTEDGTRDLKIMRLTRCRLRHCRCLVYGASVKLLEPCTLMRHFEITVVKLFFATFGWLWFFPSSMYYCDKKCDKWGSKSWPWDNETYALPTAPLSLSPLWCISEVVGALYVDAAFRNNTVVELSFVLLLVGSCFPLQPVLQWQKVRQVRIELTTFLRLWDLSAADCAVVAVSVMVHQWSYWSLVRWSGISK